MASDADSDADSDVGGTDNDAGAGGGIGSAGDSSADSEPGTGSSGAADGSDNESEGDPGVSAGEQSDAQAAENEAQSEDEGLDGDHNTSTNPSAPSEDVRGSQVADLASAMAAHGLSASPDANFGARAKASFSRGDVLGAIGNLGLSVAVGLGFKGGFNAGAGLGAAIGSSVAGPIGAAIGGLVGAAIGGKLGKAAATDAAASIGDALGTSTRDPSSSGLGVGTIGTDSTAGLSGENAEKVYAWYTSSVEKIGYIGTNQIIADYYNDNLRGPGEPAIFVKLQRVPNIIGSAHLSTFQGGII